MIILGLDPGYATIGYGVIEKSERGLRVMDYGVITTPPSETIAVRLAMIDEAMTAIMDKFSPDCVSIEELFFNTNITTGIKVAHARGVMAPQRDKALRKAEMIHAVADQTGAYGQRQGDETTSAIYGADGAQTCGAAQTRRRRGRAGCGYLSC